MIWEETILQVRNAHPTDSRLGTARPDRPLHLETWLTPSLSFRNPLVLQLQRIEPDGTIPVTEETTVELVPEANEPRS